MNLTENDRRVIDAIARAQDNWDGFIPHGAADWVAVRRLVEAGLAISVGVGFCCECDNPKHGEETFECELFQLTSQGG